MSVRLDFDFIFLRLHHHSNSLISVATQIHSGRIVWVSGGIPSHADNWIFANCGLMAKLERRPGEMGLADKGYCGKAYSHFLTTPFKGITGKAEELFNRAISAVRITIERVNGVLKSFAILSSPFRNAIELHGIIFEVLCHFTNCRIRIQPLVLKVHRILRGKRVRFDLELSRRKRGLK